MSAPFYQDELKPRTAPAEAGEESKGPGTLAMIAISLSFLAIGFTAGMAITRHQYAETITGYQKMVAGLTGELNYRAGLPPDIATNVCVNEVCENVSPLPPKPTPSSTSCPGKTCQTPPPPPKAYHPAPAPTGPAEYNPPPVPTVSGAPGPDNPGTWIPDPDN